MAPNQFDDLPRVVAAEDGFLFLTGGSNSTVALFDSASFAARVPVDQWEIRLRDRKVFFSEAQVPWRFILSPEKLSIYGDAVLKNLVGENFSPPGESFKRVCHEADEVIYPRNYLRDQASNYSVYPRTDSHWSSLGAFSTFQILCSSLGISVDFERYSSRANLPLRYHGDLWDASYGHPDPEEFTRCTVPADIREVYINPVVGLKRALGLEDNPGLHVGSHVIWFNKSAELKKKLILFGSSFSEYRLNCSMLSYILALYFEEVHFIWSANLDKSYILRHRPDYVVIEMPERFLTQCPTDDMGIEAYGLATVQRWHSK